MSHEISDMIAELKRRQTLAVGVSRTGSEFVKEWLEARDLNADEFHRFQEGQYRSALPMLNADEPAEEIIAAVAGFSFKLGFETALHRYAAETPTGG